MLTKTVNKMSMATMGLTKAFLSKTMSEAPKGARILVARVGGQIDGTALFTDKFTGEEVPGMTGDFAALSAFNDEFQYFSKSCFLPGYINDMVVSAFLAGNAGKKRDLKPFKFGYDVYIIEADTALGYQFDLDPLFEIELSSPVALTLIAGTDFAGRSNAPLLDAIAKTTVALPAPVENGAQELATSDVQKLATSDVQELPEVETNEGSDIGANPLKIGKKT